MRRWIWAQLDRKGRSRAVVGSVARQGIHRPSVGQAATLRAKARERPKAKMAKARRAKEKGKGKSKGKGKGKGFTTTGSFWICGGQHLQKDCPKGLSSMECWEADWQEDDWGEGEWIEETEMTAAPASVQQPIGYLGGLFITSLDVMPETDAGQATVRATRPSILRMMLSFTMWLLAIGLAGFFPCDLRESATELEPIGALSDSGGCEAVSFGVDSGAATTTVKSEVGRGYPVDVRGSRRYMAANKTTLTTGTATLECGDGAQVRTQVGDVSKNLMSVAEMCDAGFDVMFSNTKGYKAVHSGTGAVLSFERVGEVFDLALMVKRPISAPVFRWQSSSSYAPR